jgi:hypothetical protein
MKKKLFLLLLGFLILSISLQAQSTYLIKPDGTGDYPNIQAAIDAVVDGDIIELTDGTFEGSGNYNIHLLGKAITVKSQSGNFQDCIIKPGIFSGKNRRGFWIDGNEPPESVIKDLTIFQAGSLAP